MRVKFLILLMFAIVFCASCSQPKLDAPIANSVETAKTPEAIALNPAETAQATANLKTQANELTQTIKTQNYAKIADFTHPKVLELIGGRTKVIEAGEDIKKEGFSVVSAVAGEPKEIVSIDNELFASLPVTLQMKTPGSKNGKLEQQSTLVAVSSDNGANWKFVNGINQDQFQQLFPNAATKIQIPTDPTPTLVKDK